MNARAVFPDPIVLDAIAAAHDQIAAGHRALAKAMRAMGGAGSASVPSAAPEPADPLAIEIRGPRPRIGGERSNAVLDAWASGESRYEVIAQATGTTAQSVRTILKKARALGDPRADRRAQGGKPKPPTPTPPLMTQERPTALQERILDMWAATDLPGSAIAAALGTTKGTVSACIWKWRHRGDPRAAERPRGPRRPAPTKPEEPVPADVADPVDLPRLPAREAPAQAREEEAAPRAPVGAAAPVASPAAPLPPAPSEPFPASLVLIARVRDREVIGPAGVLSYLAAGTVKVLERLAIIREDQMMDEPTLAEIGNFKNGADVGEHLRRMSHALVRIGIDLQNPVKGFWRVRRLDGGAS